MIPKETYEKYLQIASERRQRFHDLLTNKDHYKYSISERKEYQYEIEGHAVTVPATIRTCPDVKDEPTIFYIKTLVPGTPQQIASVLDDWNERKKWDSRIEARSAKMQFHDNQSQETMDITNTITKPYLGGLISSRQATTICHHKQIDKNTWDLVECSVEHPDFPPLDTCELSKIMLNGRRIIKLNAKKLMKKYGIPEIKGDDGKVLEWSQCECMVQIDIGGYVPTWIYDKAVPGSLFETYELSRDYMISEALKLKFSKK